MTYGIQYYTTNFDIGQGSQLLTQYFIKPPTDYKTLPDIVILRNSSATGGDWSLKLINLLSRGLIVSIFCFVKN